MKSLNLLLLALFGLGFPLPAQLDYPEQWPGFRGPFATGVMDNAPLVERWDVKNGRSIQWRTRIPGLGHFCPVIWDDYVFISTAISGGITASGVAGDGKFYFTTERGEVNVLKAGPQYQLLAKNKMEDICMATPAISEGILFFRTKDYLVAVGE